MTRRFMRKTRELREAWLRGLTEGPAPVVAGPWTFAGSNRGSDYRDVAPSWVCNRKKAYPTEEIARSVASRLNEANESEETARPGYFGVVVNPYSCGRCGAWHLGR